MTTTFDITPHIARQLRAFQSDKHELFSYVQFNAATRAAYAINDRYAIRIPLTKAPTDTFEMRLPSAVKSFSEPDALVTIDPDRGRITHDDVILEAPMREPLIVDPDDWFYPSITRGKTVTNAINSNHLRDVLRVFGRAETEIIIYATTPTVITSANELYKNWRVVMAPYN